MNKLAERLGYILDSDSPWGRLVAAMAANPSATTVSIPRPPRVVRYPENIKVQDSSLGTRHTFTATFPWEGREWLEKLKHLNLPKGLPLKVIGYLSESPEVRKGLALEAEELLRSRGYSARATVRSSYKTGLFWVLEEGIPQLRRSGANRVRLRYPSPPNSASGRFLQETFPLAAFLEREGIALESAARNDGAMAYQALAFKDDRLVWQAECTVPVAERNMIDGKAVLAPTGGLEVYSGNSLVVQERLETDSEKFWDWFGGTVLPKLLELSQHQPQGPYFRHLMVSAQLSEPDVELGVGQERASMTEALSEEIYFTTLEAFKHQKGLKLDGRGLMTGRIIPIFSEKPRQDGRAKVVLIENSPGALDVGNGVVHIGASERALEVANANDLAHLQHLHHFEASGLMPEHEQIWPMGEEVCVQCDGHQHNLMPIPLTKQTSDAGLPSRPARPSEVWREAHRLAKALDLDLQIPAYSYEGRPMLTLTHEVGSDKPLLYITAGQHANETTGPKAALLLTEKLVQQSKLNLIVTPLENPDGTKLHQTLIQITPKHMHHPARYTALGDDLQSRLDDPKPRWEAAERQWSLKRKPAIHLNLHGYPSHEWTRPFNGYSPRGFEGWALTMGILVVMDFSPEQKTPAMELAREIALALGKQAPMRKLTQDALRWRSAHTTVKPPYVLIEGFPFLIWERGKPGEPIEVITEVPDETVYGQDFELLVDALMVIGQTSADWLVKANKQA